MNIYLLPYTASRHLAMALWCAGAGLLAWWAVLCLMVPLGLASWGAEWDGPVLLCAVAAAVTGASIAGEDNLMRSGLRRRALRLLLGVGLAVALTALGYAAWTFGLPALLPPESAELINAQDVSLVSLSYRAGLFPLMGLSCGAAAMLVRRFEDPVSHVFGGLASGLFGGGLWYLFNGTNLSTDFYELLLNGSTLGKDLYLSGAMFACGTGFSFGLLTWGIPDNLYAGWLRVLTPTRFARRIPVDALDGTAKERFLGHFPRGLDLWLPVQDGVMELHLSVAVDERQRYAARGLSLQGTTVHRFLERIDLRYDPRRPAPLETELSSGDRVVLKAGEGETVLEFIMLPREER